MEKRKLMKKLLNYFNKIKVNKFTVLIISLAIISGRFIPLFIYFSIASIHEFSHCLMAKIFKLEIRKIEFLPFGMSAELASLNDIHPIKSILILLAGPLSFFISKLLIEISYQSHFLSVYAYLQANEINTLIFFFNLLPIWPLDGAKILFYLMSFFLTLKKNYYFVITISIISTIILTFLTIKDPQLIILFFLVFSQIKIIYEVPIIYITTLIKRIKNECRYPFRIHKKKDIFLPYSNIYDDEKSFLLEKDFILNIIESKK